MFKHTLGTMLAIPLLLLAACGGATPPPPTVTPPATVLGSADLSAVPRNRSLMIGMGLNQDGIGITNPLNPKHGFQDGDILLWEGLAYYAIFADKEIPWLAQSMEYTKADYTELTIKLNPLARWSDGQPVTAQDLLFTFQLQVDNDATGNHVDFQNFVQAFRAVDDHTVVLTFKVPAPHFKFDVLTFKFDSGLVILPAHAFSGQADIINFAGALDIVHSGPYRLVYWDADRKIYDLRPDWWAVTAGLIQPPAVQRVIYADTSAISIDTLAAKIINNEFDTGQDLPTPVIANILKNNPKVTTYSGNAPPYGALDWFPNSLWLNTQLAPYSDVRVRQALSLAIDRDRLDEAVYQGAPVATIYPFPLYPGLQKFADSPEMKALAAQYQPRKFDVAESAQLMTEAGFAKNTDGLWARDGLTLDATIHAFQGIHTDLAPLLAEMLRRAGFDASVDFSNQSWVPMFSGGPGLYLFGHLGSLVDPYATLALYHSRHSAPAGTPVAEGFFSRYSDPAYDQLIDAMPVLPADDPQFQALATQAMEIYWREVIDIPIVQWLHRIPYNQTYWTNWPTRDNPAMGTDGTYWHTSGLPIIASLKPAQ
ncbi:MAG: ABC transporter substrate-binding protein [Anaerolineales bacterium]